MIDLPWNRPPEAKEECTYCKQIFHVSQVTGGEYRCIMDETFQCDMIIYNGRLCDKCEQEIADLHEKEMHSSIDII